jgi:Na+/proline symporter
MTGVPVREPGAGVRDVRRAWWSLALFPVSFLAAFAVGEGLASLLGHPSGSPETAPVWVMLAAGGPALLVFVLPAVLAVVFARRAEREGDRSGRVPMWVAVVLATAFVLLNVVQGVLVVLLE